MNKKIQMLCIYCGLVGICLFGVGFWLAAGFIPPLSPADSAQEIKDQYADNANGIRLGLLIVMIAGALTGPWVAAISHQIKRIEKQYGLTVLSSTQLGMGMLGVLVFIIPTFMMQAAAFRPNRDADLIMVINDMAWLPFVGIWALLLIQGMAIAIAVFIDKEQRVFPRWLAYFNVWVVLLYAPTSVVFFFKEGPFAWDGVIVFYLPAVTFFVWYFVMFVMMRKAILGEGDFGVDPVSIDTQVESESR